MLKYMKVVVTGASGFVGKYIRKYLSDNNVNLVSISRSDFKKFKNDTKVNTKNYDEKFLLTKLKHSDALIHLVGIGRQTINSDYNLVNTEFTKNIVNLCKKLKIQKFIYLSGLGVSKKTTLAYFISKYKAEHYIIESNLDYTIFRPSYIVGKDDHFTKYLKKQIKNGQIQLPGSGNYSIQPIYIDDVSRIIFNSLTNTKFSKKIFDLVGPESITYENYIKEFFRHTKTKIIKTNLETIYHQAINHSNSELGVDDLNLLIGDFKGNFNKLSKNTPIDFHSIRELLKSGSLL